MTVLKVFCTTPNALYVFDKKALKKTMRQAGQEVSNVAKRYIRSSTGGPGQPPKSQTGTLIRSIKVAPWKSGMGVAVKATALNKRGQPYGLFLEAGVQFQTNPANRPKRVHRKRGTQVQPMAGQTTIAPRPFLSRALEDRRTSIAQRIGASVDAGVAFKKMK